MKQCAFTVPFVLAVMLPNTVAAEEWTDFATTIPDVSVSQRGACKEGYIAGLKVKEQSNYGIIDVSLVCRTEDGKLHESQDWIIDIASPSVVKGPDTCTEDEVVKGMVARVQSGYGVVDIKLACGKISEKPELSNTRQGITLNKEGKDHPAIYCPANSNPVAMMVHVQSGYGVVNYKLLCR